MSDDRAAASADGTLVGWLSRHAELDRRWTVAWCAVPEQGSVFEEAARSFALALRLHVDQEERRLLPAWAEVADAPPNATAEVLRREHRTLLAHVDGALAAPTRRSRAERWWSLGEVLHHHDAREAASIKPGLDARLPAELVRAWLAEFAAEEQALPPAFALPPLRPSAPDGPEPEDALAADAPVSALVEAMSTPDHPRGRVLSARLQTVARVRDAEPEPLRRRERSREVWAALRLVRIVATIRPRPGGER